LLGVPPSFIEEDGFRFANSLAHTQNQRHNPWSLLEQPLDDDALPVIGEANTVIWMLKSGLGKDLTVRDERGQETRLRIVGLLQDSIFQSGLLLSEANFLKLFPSQGGDSFFLIKAPPGLDADVKILLETALGKHGFEVTPTGERLGAYWAVENTYLTTFQALGGLGLLMGTIGLAVVLLRSIWERRGELALLRALGYRARALDWLLLFENGFLLLLGMGAGTATALLAVMPHLLGSASQVPWWRLIILLTLALAIGLVTQSVALVFTLRTPLLAALRRE
jgi:ABC-type antimicrobial peptide transport system permease subunit